MVTLIWHACISSACVYVCAYKVHKIHQMYVFCFSFVLFLSFEFFGSLLASDYVP